MSENKALREPVNLDTNVNQVFWGTADDLIAQFKATCRTASPIERAERLAPFYTKWCRAFLVRADFAWCQMAHETGHLTFTGDVAPGQNNFSGIGATGGVPGNSFKTEELGVIAQVAHIAWYSKKKHWPLRDPEGDLYCSMKYDPRHFDYFDPNGHRYRGGAIKSFSEAWAVGAGGYRYPEAIVRLMNRFDFGEKENDKNKQEDGLDIKILEAINIKTDRKWKYIAIHHSVSDQFRTTMEKIRAWHLARGWLREGYHFGIDGNGLIEVGRPLTMSGAHVGAKYNRVAIGICLYGDFRYCQPTQKQLASAYRLCQELMKVYGIPREKVKGHNDFMATLCPVIDMDEFRKNFNKFIKK